MANSFACNTVLVVGSTSGIGLALAEYYHKRGKTVIVTGRRAERIEEIVKRNGGDGGDGGSGRMHGMVVDVTDAKALEVFAKEVISKFPDLDCVINCSGIQRPFQFQDPSSVDLHIVDQEIDTNFRSLVHLTNHFLPHLLSKSRAYLMHTSSGLGLIPASFVPVYSATKAAVHSFCQTLRHQLRDTSVKVVEIIPPYVDTELQAGHRPTKGVPMPLQEYIEKTVELLEKDVEEAAVGMAAINLVKINDVVMPVFNFINPKQQQLQPPQ